VRAGRLGCWEWAEGELRLYPVRGQHFANGGFDNAHAALAHLADDAREAGESAVIDAEDGGNLLRSDPRPAGLRLRGATVGLTLLVALEPADAVLGRDEPVEEFAEGAADRAGACGSLQPFSD
jgi:hypothetical protein